MNDERTVPESDLARVRARVARLSVRGPSPEFRSRLGDAFVSGAVPGGRTDLPEMLEDPGRWPSEPRRFRGGRWWRWSLIPAGAVAAAAALWVFVVPKEPGASPFVLVATDGGGRVRCGEAELTPTDLRGARFRPGDRIRTGEGVELGLVQGDLFAVELSAGCDLDLPCDAGDGRYRAVVREGTATWVTGPAFPGRELRIVAPDAEVVVLGTTFAVLADAEKTCISVFAGEVGVITPDGAVHSVCAGRCRQIYRAGSPPTEAELDPLQVANLGTWHERSHELLPTSPTPH